MPEPQLRYDERSPFIVHMLLLAIIYLAFISLGLPDSLVGAGWPAMHESLGVPLSCAGFITFIIATGTIISSLMSDRLTTRFGPGRVTAASVALTAAALFGFSFSVWARSWNGRRRTQQLCSPALHRSAHELAARLLGTRSIDQPVHHEPGVK